jgi:hypothetical protein
VHHRTVWALAAIVLLVILSPIHLAQAQEPGEEEGEVAITAPRYGETISGLVLVTGTALSPDFHHYELAYAVDPNPDDQWFPVQDAIAQQVQENVLGAWDTTRVADGPYLLRLQVVRNDGTAQATVIQAMVINATPTPLPSPLPTPTGTMTPTAGPTPTPLIYQPPTRTPRPTNTPGGPTPTPRPPRRRSPLDSTQLRRAAWTGIYVALAAFGLMSLYFGLRRVIRGRIRAWWYRFWEHRGRR